MRNRIWSWITASLPSGMILPWWALTIRAILFPLDAFYWYMSKTRGYQWVEDTWLIEGVRYDASALRQMAKSDGETYRITRSGDMVILKLVKYDELLYAVGNKHPNETRHETALRYIRQAEAVSNTPEQKQPK